MFIHNFSHFMLIWIFPPGLILLLMLGGFLLTRYGKSYGNKVCICAYILFWLLSTPVLAQALIDGLQKQYPPLPASTLAASQSEIVVLGHGVENSPEFSPRDKLSEVSASRIFYTAYLARKLHVPVVVSGGNRNNIAHSEAEVMRNDLQNSYATAVNSVENTSRNTQEQSTLLLPILKNNNIRNVYLVTNAWHMPRSMYVFKKAFTASGIDIIPAPMGYISLKSESVTMNLMPSLKALNTSAIALYEYVGIIWYHIY
jgi:uncharacterized SAM-binding protein YcdF (DUF218 family)